MSHGLLLYKKNINTPHLKNKGLVPVSHKNIINPAVGKEQTAKGGVLYEGRMFSR